MALLKELTTETMVSTMEEAAEVHTRARAA
jgi:hypothetical protein